MKQILVAIFLLTIHCGEKTNNSPELTEPEKKQEIIDTDSDPVDHGQKTQPSSDKEKTWDAKYASLEIIERSNLALDSEHNLIVNPDDIDSLTLQIKGEDSYYYTFSNLISPDNEILIDTQKNPYYCIDCKMRVAATEGIHSLLLSNSPLVSLTKGSFKFKISGYGLSKSKTKKTTIASNPVDLKIFLKRKSSDNPNKIDLNLFFSGSSSLTAENAKIDYKFQKGLKYLKEIYEKAGLEFGQINYIDLPEGTSKQILTIDGKDSDMHKLFSIPKETSPGVSFFFVESIQDINLDAVGIILGVSGGIPGPIFEPGSIKSGIAISTDFAIDTPRSFANTMAHELGHYLGLFHSSEMKFPGQDQIHDQIEDTGENEESNIMYFRSFDKEQILSDQQAEIIKRGALVY